MLAITREMRQFESIFLRATLLGRGHQEGRHWENDGSVEDVATGSAAAPAAAVLVRAGLAEPGEVVIRQGRFRGRPSLLRVRVTGELDRIEISGPVSMVASGQLDDPADVPVAIRCRAETRMPGTRVQRAGINEHPCRTGHSRRGV